MTHRLLMIALLAISLTGCYTSFSPRDYEEENYGQMNESYYGSPETAEIVDSSEYFYPEEEYFQEPIQGLTVINNYGQDCVWGYSSPFYSNFYPSYGFYDYYYDPFYSPYYGPYYGGNVFVYGDAYFGGYYGGSSYYPSQVRYRTNTSHWTSLRNTGKRNVSTNRTRGVAINTVRTNSREPFVRDNFLTVKGINLDKDLQVSRIASRGSSTTNSGFRTASISRSRDGKTNRTVKRTTDLERRRISTNKNKEITRSSSKSKYQRVTQSKKPVKRVYRETKTNKRSKRVYSSSSSKKSSSRSSYYKPSRKSSSSKVSSSTRSRRPATSSYSSKSSRSSSSRSTVSRSSNHSSRSSASRSSSRSSSSSRSKSGSSSRRR